MISVIDCFMSRIQHNMYLRVGLDNLLIVCLLLIINKRMNVIQILVFPLTTTCIDKMKKNSNMQIVKLEEDRITKFQKILSKWTINNSKRTEMPVIFTSVCQLCSMFMGNERLPLYSTSVCQVWWQSLSNTLPSQAMSSSNCSMLGCDVCHVFSQKPSLFQSFFMVFFPFIASMLNVILSISGVILKWT